MNESTVSSKFQTDLRAALPTAVVVKHADKSMIGMVDASVTYNKKTLFMEYKFIGPTTKGVNAAFMSEGGWHPAWVASASPTQFDMAQRLAKAGHCIYIFWVLDHAAVRKRVGYVQIWHPLTGQTIRVKPNELVAKIIQIMQVGENTLVKP